jgi:glycosyltransferase involved in cell wall biosynthesis
VSTIHGFTFEMYPAPKRLVYRVLDTLTSYLAAANVAVSQAVAAELRCQGYVASRLRVIPNGVPVPAVLSSPRRVSHPVRVGVVARLSPEKGHRLFLEAARKVAAASPERVQFAIIGQGPEEGRLRGYCQDLGLEEHVVFRGFRSDMTAEYTNLDVVTLPSLGFEGIGMALLEAMSFGLPVVSTAVGGTVEAVNEDVGLLVPPGDPDSLAEAISELVQDEKRRREMGEAAREWAKRFFSVETMAWAYETLYLAVTKG